MRLNHLSLTNFRNYTRLDIDVPPGALVVVGSNAQGKTSLLEAIYFLATFASFHADNDRQMINLLARREPLAVARIVADYCRGDSSHRLEVRVIQEANEMNGFARTRKEVLLDGVKRKASEVIGHFNAVLFLPQMLRVLEGPPEERRRYLNLALAQVSPAYAPALSAYNRALTQRNALLKQLGERGGDGEQLIYWDDQIASLGALLIHARINAVRELERVAARTHQGLTRGKEVLRLDYRPAFDPLGQPPGQYSLPIEDPLDRSVFSLEEIRTAFLRELGRLHTEEIARGVTTIGPHRDELRFLSNGIDLGVYGSRGQARTTLLTLKLAEVAWMQARTGFWPVLLLDEVLAELDTERRSDLLARMAECEQALLTTTDLNLFGEDFTASATVWTVHAGRLQ